MIKYFGDPSKVNEFGIISAEDVAEIISVAIKTHKGFECLLNTSSISNRKISKTTTFLRSTF